MQAAEGAVAAGMDFTIGPQTQTQACKDGWKETVQGFKTADPRNCQVDGPR